MTAPGLNGGNGGNGGILSEGTDLLHQEQLVIREEMAIESAKVNPDIQYLVSLILTIHALSMERFSHALKEMVRLLTKDVTKVADKLKKDSVSRAAVYTVIGATVIPLFGAAMIGSADTIAKTSSLSVSVIKQLGSGCQQSGAPLQSFVSILTNAMNTMNAPTQALQSGLTAEKQSGDQSVQKYGGQVQAAEENKKKLDDARRNIQQSISNSFRT